MSRYKTYANLLSGHLPHHLTSVKVLNKSPRKKQKEDSSNKVYSFKINKPEMDLET